MVKRSTILVVVSALSGFAACGGASAPARTPARAPQPSAEPASKSGEEPTARTTLTAQACEADGGSVVGDIGDGAIHRPEYRCPNGAKPTGSIGAAEGGPIAIEGSVCCPR